MTNLFLSKRAQLPMAVRVWTGGNDCLCRLLYNAVGLPEVEAFLHPLCELFWGESSRAASVWFPTNKKSLDCEQYYRCVARELCRDVFTQHGSFSALEKPLQKCQQVARTPGERCRNAKVVGAQWASVCTVWDAVVAGTSPLVFRMSL